MKKLTTTILILFVCFGCKIREGKPIITPKSNGVTYATYVCLNCNDTDKPAKKSNTNNITVDGTGRIYNSSYSIAHPEYDTQKVIMLVCDTSAFVEVYSGNITIDAHGNIVPNATHDYHSGWQYGNKVTSKHGTGEIEYSYEDGKYVPYPVYDYDFVNYLDADKKPLSKSIIVWQTKELK